MTHLFFVGSGQEDLFREKTSKRLFLFFVFHLYFPFLVPGSHLYASEEI